MDFIPYGRQTIDEDDIAAVIEALKSDYLTTGPKIKEFEYALCQSIGSKYAVAVSNGTAALHIAAMAAGIGCGDEVIVPAITFAASANCVLYCGGTPVFVDIEPDTLLMDVEDVKRKITSKTKAIIPVHFTGETCDMQALSDLAEEYNLQIIQDCSHSIGSKVYNKNLGEFKGQQTWSFHPVKTVTTGEGGAVTTNDKGIYDKLLLYRTHGITRNSNLYSHESQGDWYYEMQSLGYNYRLTDIQCALGISQLKKLESFAKRRKEIVEIYDRAFKDLPVKIQRSPDYSDAVRHLYTIQVDRRDSIFNALKSKNIGVNLHYIPVYMLPYYERLGYAKGLCKNAENYYKSAITIPLYPAMTDNQVDYVINCVKEVV